MKIVFILSGLMWILFGVAFLALSASVVSAPTHILTLRNIAYIIIGIFFILGLYFIKTGLLEKRKNVHRICNYSFYRIMLKNKFKIHISEFARVNNININDANEYINSRTKITNGILTFTGSGHIIINKYKNN